MSKASVLLISYKIAYLTFLRMAKHRMKVTVVHLPIILCIEYSGLKYLQHKFLFLKTLEKCDAFNLKNAIFVVALSNA